MLWRGLCPNYFKLQMVTQAKYSKWLGGTRPLPVFSFHSAQGPVSASQAVYPQTNRQTYDHNSPRPNNTETLILFRLCCYTVLQKHASDLSLSSLCFPRRRVGATTVYGRNSMRGFVSCQYK